MVAYSRGTPSETENMVQATKRKYSTETHNILAFIRSLALNRLGKDAHNELIELLAKTDQCEWSDAIEQLRTDRPTLFRK
jgi:hypothetical protein